MREGEQMKTTSYIAQRVYRPMKKLLLLALLLLPGLAHGQSWTGVLSTARAINWTGAGLPATLPDGETTPNPWTPPTRTQCGSTINPSGDSTGGTDVGVIQTAIQACASGHFVLLGAGTFYISHHGNCFGGSATCLAFFNPATGTTPVNGVTVRGSGAQSTILDFNAGGSALFTMTISSTINTCSWTGGLSAGSTSLTTASCSPGVLVNGIAGLNQCDTGYSGATCATGSTSDNGGLLVCKNNNGFTCANQVLGGEDNIQDQQVLITNVSGSTVTIASPGVYMPNWTSGNTPTISQASFQTNSDGIEDLTIYAPSNVTQTYLVDVGTSNASWVKGVRFIGSGNNAPLGIQGSKNILLSNNYLFSDPAIDANFPPPIQTDTSSDFLILNNIMANSVPWEGNGGNAGGVYAYNFARDCFTAYMENITFDHTGFSSFDLFEGNQLGGILDDNTWGTHGLNTWFRGYHPGWDTPYVNVHPRGMAIDAFQRFDNLVGNVVGSQYITIYTGTGDNSAFRVNGGGLTDTLTATSLMRWGNVSSVTQGTDTPANSGVRFVSSEVPTTLTGNAIPFENSVPGSNTLPCSFFLAGYTSTSCTAHPSGGTGLSFWKVCTAWTTFPTSCSTSQLQPFPFAGPDVTSGPYVSGHAYDNPASIAFQNLPIDTTYQVSYTITASSWSGGVETLTISGLPNVTHLMGPFQITSGACSTLGLPNGEGYITGPASGSSTTQITYALASNPGACTGSFKFPDIRQFDERVYQLDSGGSAAPVTAPALSFALNLEPLPAVTPSPVAGSGTPVGSYFTAKGFSQDGINWTSTLTYTATGTNLNQVTSCALDSTAVPCTCGSSSSCVLTIPTTAAPIPTAKTAHTISLFYPAAPAIPKPN